MIMGSCTDSERESDVAGETPGIIRSIKILSNNGNSFMEQYTLSITNDWFQDIQAVIMPKWLIVYQTTTWRDETRLDDLTERSIVMVDKNNSINDNKWWQW